MPDHQREPWHEEAFPPFEARPTRFKTIAAICACAVVAALALAIALPGAWEVLGEGMW